MFNILKVFLRKHSKIQLFLCNLDVEKFNKQRNDFCKIKIYKYLKDDDFINQKIEEIIEHITGNYDIRKLSKKNKKI